MTSFSDAGHFWRGATYASVLPTRGTSFRFEQGPWVTLPEARNAYVWDDTDIDAARAELIINTNAQHM
jgi:hypothetical protein